MRRAIRTHSRDFVAMLALLVLAVVVAGYVLIHERFRFPFISTPQYTLYADLSTAQAVTPGQ
ncbi:MAG: MlaD family protein, partial [Solirubrobacteraceae bacterium]